MNKNNQSVWLCQWEGTKVKQLSPITKKGTCTVKILKVGRLYDGCVGSIEKGFCLKSGVLYFEEL